MENCIFCKIVNGDIPSYKIYEDDDVLAFLDISKVTKGHALVIPKKHYENFMSCPKETMTKVMEVAQKIANAEMEVLGAKGVNILSNANQVAGQVVMHFLVHVIPRYSIEDKIKIEFKENNEDLDLSSIAKLVKEKM